MSSTETDCANGLDDGMDGDTDCADSDCTGQAIPGSQSICEATETLVMTTKTMMVMVISIVMIWIVLEQLRVRLMERSATTVSMMTTTKRQTVVTPLLWSNHYCNRYQWCPVDGYL